MALKVLLGAVDKEHSKELMSSEKKLIRPLMKPWNGKHCKGPQ
jgi:hypothetical protein